MASLASLLAYTDLGVAVALLVFALLLLRVLGASGGQDLALARLAANPTRRRLFLSGLYASLASLFAIGLATSLEVILRVSSDMIDATQTALFVIGAIGIFIIMSDALRRQSLTLQEKWNLQETAERAMMQPDPGNPPSAWEIPSDGPRPYQGRP
jgi:hypothetical protein